MNTRELQYFTDESQACPKGYLTVESVFDIPDRPSNLPTLIGGKRQHRFDFQAEHGTITAASAESAEDKDDWLTKCRTVLGEIADLSKHPHHTKNQVTSSSPTTSPRPRADSVGSNRSSVGEFLESNPVILIAKEQWLYNLIMSSWDHGEYATSWSGKNMGARKWVCLFFPTHCNLCCMSI
jgi:hypothetical protein